MARHKTEIEGSIELKQMRIKITETLKNSYSRKAAGHCQIESDI